MIKKFSFIKPRKSEDTSEAEAQEGQAQPEPVNEPQPPQSVRPKWRDESAEEGFTSQGFDESPSRMIERLKAEQAKDEPAGPIDFSDAPASAEDWVGDGAPADDASAEEAPSAKLQDAPPAEIAAQSAAEDESPQEQKPSAGVAKNFGVDPDNVDAEALVAPPPPPAAPAPAPEVEAASGPAHKELIRRLFSKNDALGEEAARPGPAPRASTAFSERPPVAPAAAPPPAAHELEAEAPAAEAEPSPQAPPAPEQSGAPIDMYEQVRMVEAMLFASSKPLSTAELAARMPAVGCDAALAVRKLEEHYNTRGVRLVRVAGKWAFRTASDLAHLMLTEQVEQRKLSKAAMETLAIVAYHQPVTRAEIEEIRQVGVSKGTLDLLMELEWIKLGRRRQAPGRPVTYITTEGFLDHFELETTKDLPGLDELRQAGLLDNRPMEGLTPPELDDREDAEEIEEDDEEEDSAEPAAPLTL